MTIDVQFNVDQALAKLGDLVTAHGAQAVDLAAQVTQIKAINDLTDIPFYGATGVAGVLIARALFRKAKARLDNDSCDGEFGAILLCVISGCIGLFSCVAIYHALWRVFDVWMWVGLFNPKLALAHDIMTRLTGSQ